MKYNQKIAKIIFCVLAAVVLIYVMAYASLRLSHILVARDYIVYDFGEGGPRVFVNHFDIGRGAAFKNGKPQFNSILGTIYRPLSFVELQLRGYGKYPKVWSSEEGCKQ